MEKQPFFNPYVEPYVFFFNFFIGIPSVLYLWAMNSRPVPSLENTVAFFALVMCGAFYLPRWIANAFNIVGGTITRNHLPWKQLPSWRLKVPFPFSRYQIIKVVNLGIGTLVLSQYYFLTLTSDTFLLTFLLLFIASVIPVWLSESSDGNGEEISLDERKKFVGEVLKNLDPEVPLSFFHSPFPIAYVNKNRVFISDTALKLPLNDLKRLVYHEYAHTRQKHRFLFLILLAYQLFILSILFYLRALPWLFLPVPVSSLSFYALLDIHFLPLWYLLSIPIPFFFVRSIFWKMELSAESWACAQMTREDYLKAVEKSLEQLETWKKTHSRVPGFGLERYYFYYPSFTYQIYNALKECE